MDRLANTTFLKDLTGQVYLSQDRAFTAISARLRAELIDDPFLPRGMI